MSQNVVLLLAPPKPTKTYTLDEVSVEDINGRVLIEACVPRAALTKFYELLDKGDY